MLTLSGKQTGKLNEALDDAFDGVDALDDFLREMLDRKLDNLADRPRREDPAVQTDPEGRLSGLGP